MKKILLSLSISILIASPCFAKTYIIIESSSKKVISVSPEDDAQVEPGQEKIIIDDKFEDLTFTDHPTFYQYKNKKFVKDMDRISSSENNKNKIKNRQSELDLVTKRMRKNAYDELKGEGVIFSELKDTDFQ